MWRVCPELGHLGKGDKWKNKWLCAGARKGHWGTPTYASNTAIDFMAG
jgi:hypothetical protein